jgi:hypothetical protein
LANKISHAFCLRARRDYLSYARSSDEVIQKVDNLLSYVHSIYNQAVEELIRALNEKLQELLPPERRLQGAFPKKYPEGLETDIKDNLEAILSEEDNEY